MSIGRPSGPRNEHADPVRVVRLTPPGRGAVAVVLVEGSRATEIVAACFSSRSGQPLDEVPLERITLGRWGGPEGEELIVCRTTSQRVEVHPHGGEAAVENVVQRLVELGAVECSWQAWIGSDEGCPLRAAARIALAEAPTRRAAAVLLDQFHGALRADLQQAIDLLEQDASAARQILARLSRRGELGMHLARPWRVVLAGAPNVGKSSLVNALVGYERAIVYEQPGTTRDVVAARTAIAGWPVELSDTAGLRESSDPLEAEGVRLAELLLTRADLVVYVLDATLPPAGLPRQLTVARNAGRQTVVVLNKVDLLDERQREAIRQFTNERVLCTSARTREGIDGLLDAIASALVPDPPTPGEAVPFERHHCEQIDAALASLDASDVPSTAAILHGLLTAHSSSHS